MAVVGIVAVANLWLSVTHRVSGMSALALKPVYRTPGCIGGSYRSFIVVHRESSAASLEDLRGARCTIDGVASQSGINMLRREVVVFFRSCHVRATSGLDRFDRRGEG